MTFLIPLAVMNGIAIFIAALLIVLNRFVAVYGSYSLTINNERVFQVDGGQSITKLLFHNKIYLPSACGGKGTCGFCKVRIVEGTNPPLPIEEMLLSHREIALGYRLGCQTKVRSDLSIEIPPDLLAVKEYNGKVIATEMLTKEIKRIKIKLIEPQVIEFKSGQYVLIEARIDETRAYSIASSNLTRDSIDLEVKLIPNGVCSTYLHSLKEEESIKFFGPYGQFYLQDSNHNVICVAGGVGLAPMKPIIYETLRRYPGRKIQLYYGARTFADLYDHQTLAELAEKNPLFSYYPALSESDVENKTMSYPVAAGFIHTILNERVKDGPNSEGYLCGPPVMIDAVLKVLIAKGVPEIRILYDKF